eukprot:6210586-Pleurochrysis_carterae.AAC.1
MKPARPTQLFSALHKVPYIFRNLRAKLNRTLLNTCALLATDLLLKCEDTSGVDQVTMNSCIYIICSCYNLAYHCRLVAARFGTIWKEIWTSTNRLARVSITVLSQPFLGFCRKASKCVDGGIRSVRNDLKWHTTRKAEFGCCDSMHDIVVNVMLTSCIFTIIHLKRIVIDDPAYSIGIPGWSEIRPHAIDDQKFKQ